MSKPLLPHESSVDGKRSVDLAIDARSRQLAGPVEDAAHPPRAGRIGLWALVIGLVIFLVWAAFAPLDEGVPAAGQVALDTKRKTVQHLSGGILQEVLVREGDEVTEGQPLMRMDSAVARANYEASRQKYLGLRAMQSRLQAEQSGQASITWHPDLVAARTDPLIDEQMQTQKRLFDSRRQLLASDLQSMQENIQGQEGQLTAYKSMLVGRNSQLALLNEELGKLRGVVADGYAPRNRQLEMERMVADSHTAIADLQGGTIRTQQTILELRQRMNSRRQDFRREVESQLADVSREVLAEHERFRAVSNDLARAEIKAPASGQVVGLAVQTVGAVVQPGQKLMDIVPKGAPLLLEARVAPHLIDRVHTDLPVDVRFSSFAHTPQLVVHGRVESVSRDLLTEPQTNISYYLARVEVTPEGMQQLGKRTLQPGMPVEVIFKTGERSLLTYLLSPLTKRIAASMKEE